MATWDLAQAWEQRWCPMVNGLLFPDGTVIPVRAWPAASGAPSLGPRTRLTDFAAGGPIRWTTVEPLARATTEDRVHVAAAGEGGHPGDGFVALLSGVQKGLAWLAFFDDGGSFVTVRFEGGCVVAGTAAGRELRLPLEAPERLSVALPRP